MGGSGGGYSSGISPKALSDRIRDAEKETSLAAFETELANLFSDLLSNFNDRDVESIRERLEDIQKKLEGSVEGSFNQLFGGSVAKHTYVDGMSDIDSLLVLNETDFKGDKPAEILGKLTSILRKKLGDDVEVSHGRMAVTVEYRDGMTLQLLPAFRFGGKLRVPSFRHDGWSNIDPKGFQQALTKTNADCAGKLVPTIKLAKAINGNLPEKQQLSGYHIESLAIAAFKGYDGPKKTTAMLSTFFEKAKDLVLSPIKDSTGQSVHVDDYLGAANSQNRVNASHILGRIAKRMRNASAAGSKAQWRTLFETDE